MRQYSHYLQIKMTFLVVLECVWVDLPQEGHTNTTPKCTLHTCVHIVAHEVDGPSFQPPTKHLYTLLMPPNCRQRDVMLAEIATSRASGAAGETASGACFTPSLTGLEASGTAPLGSQVGGLGMVAVGVG